MDRDLIVRVNEQDEVIGYAPKMEVHKNGWLHRAVSVFLFNSKGEWLLQKRAGKKYHSGNLWSNTACTHPFKDESNISAAQRRLLEEMGMQAPLSSQFSFIYKAQLDKGLTEHELDHIFFGTTDQLPNPNPGEVSDYRFVSTVQLQQEIKSNPETFTEWFKLLFIKVEPRLNNYLK